MAPRQIRERRISRDFATRPRAQPGRALIDHRMRDDRGCAPHRFRKRDSEWIPAIDDRDLIGLKRNGLIVLAEMTFAVQVHGYDVEIFWRASNLLTAAYEFVTGAVERGKTKIAKAAAANAGGEVRGRRLRRNVEHRLANYVVPVRKALTRPDRIC
jgi:hypothetical protein